MFKISLVRNLHVLKGVTELRLKLKDGQKVSLLYSTGVSVRMEELASFALTGELLPDETEYNVMLKNTIDLCKSAMSEVYLSWLSKKKKKIEQVAFQEAVYLLLHPEEAPEPSVQEQSLVKRFRQYLEEEHNGGIVSDRVYRDSVSLANKLERYFIIRACPGLPVKSFTPEMLVDFEKFCINEYLYAADPKYADVYPRDYEKGRSWPKRKLKEAPLKKLLNHFRMFWRDMVSFGEVEVSPYEDYVPWMEEVPKKRYSELIGSPISLNYVEFQKVLSTPVPESLAQTRNAFILQCCLGCRCEDFGQLSMENVGVSKEGIPYIYYTHTAIRKKEKKEFKYEIRVPLVRVAYDIVMRTRFDFFLGSYYTPYNRLMQVLLRHCGITREVDLLNTRTGSVETVPLCDAMTQMQVYRTHLDLLRESEKVKAIRSGWFSGATALERLGKQPIEKYFKDLNAALGQPSYRVDENLNIIEGTPFVKRDVLVYREIPEKTQSGATNPYIITQLLPVAEGEGDSEERIEVQYGRSLARERSVAVLGSQFLEFIESLEDGHREWIQYGLLLLKRMADLDVLFIKRHEKSLFELKTALRGYAYSTYFYINGDSVIVLHGCLDEKHRRHKASGNVSMKQLQQIRWEHVIGNSSASEYDSVLDAAFGPAGSTERQNAWAMACCSYVSQVLREARITAGLSHEEVCTRMGLATSIGQLTRAENGYRVLPFKYVRRILGALGLKAVVTRPVVEE